jgi:hypothetical protein
LTRSTVALAERSPRLATTRNSGGSAATRPRLVPATTPNRITAAPVEAMSPMTSRDRTGNPRTRRALSSPSPIMPAALSANTRLNCVADRPYTSCSANDEPEM